MYVYMYAHTYVGMDTWRNVFMYVHMFKYVHTYT